jgi:hypothetical protein
MPEPATILPAPAAPMPQPSPPIMMPLPMDGPALRARFGAPDFVRREMGSELWRYDSGSCAIFFFLYPDGGMLKLRYFETLPRGMGMAADPACLAALNGRVGSMS